MPFQVNISQLVGAERFREFEDGSKENAHAKAERDNRQIVCRKKSRNDRTTIPSRSHRDRSVENVPLKPFHKVTTQRNFALSPSSSQAEQRNDSGHNYNPAHASRHAELKKKTATRKSARIPAKRDSRHGPGKTVHRGERSP